MKPLREELIAKDLASFIVEANEDLVIAEIEENFEQCQLIQSAIYLTLNSEAENLAKVKSAYTQNQIFNIFKFNSDWVYSAIKERYSS